MMFLGLRAVAALGEAVAREEFKLCEPAAKLFRYTTADVVQDPPGRIVRSGVRLYSVEVCGGENAEEAERAEDGSGRSPSV